MFDETTTTKMDKLIQAIQVMTAIIALVGVVLLGSTCAILHGVDNTNKELRSINYHTSSVGRILSTIKREGLQVHGCR